MALVSGGSSALNPNAPLFIPAAFRQVEDFSPEWWNLIKTSTSFHDYWLSENADEDIFNGNDANDFDDSNVSDLLPETFYLGAEDFLNMEAQFEEFIQSSETEGYISSFLDSKGVPKDGLKIDTTTALMRNLSLTKSPKGRGARYAINPAMYNEKPAKYLSPKCSPRLIQQPR